MLNYNKGIDGQNLKLFNKYGLSRDNEYIFKCVVCENDTCISRSLSNNGHKMICTSCFNKLFNTKDGWEWLEHD